MADAQHATRISMPATAKRGEIIEIKTLIQHEMETGYRRDADGRIVPRDIIVRFVATFDGETVFSAETFPGIAANPYLVFSMIAIATGELILTWADMAGRTTTQKRMLTVA